MSRAHTSLEALPHAARALMRERARAIAERVGAAATQDDLEVMALRCRDQVFMVPLPAVEGVADLVSVADIPGAPGFVRGLASFRGEILVAADLGVLVAHQAGITDLRWLVSLTAGGRRLGLLAERVPTVEQVDAAVFTPAGSALPFVDRVDAEMRTLIDAPGLIAHVFAALERGQ